MSKSNYSSTRNHHEKLKVGGKEQYDSIRLASLLLYSPAYIEAVVQIVRACGQERSTANHERVQVVTGYGYSTG